MPPPLGTVLSPLIGDSPQEGEDLELPWYCNDVLLPPFLRMPFEQGWGGFKTGIMIWDMNSLCLVPVGRWDGKKHRARCFHWDFVSQGAVSGTERISVKRVPLMPAFQEGSGWWDDLVTPDQWVLDGGQSDSETVLERVHPALWWVAGGEPSSGHDHGPLWWVEKERIWRASSELSS